MPELVYKDRMLSPEEFQHDLQQAIDTANPVDDLLMLTRRLYAYEQKYNMTSEDFYRCYQAGVLDDELQHCLMWAAIYKMFVRTKRVVESALMRTAIQPELDKVAV
jgi:hypothetical protein